MRRLLRDEAGSSAVEVALVAPVIVAALLWSLYLTELGLVRIRQQEASRFLTWEMSAHEAQDFHGEAHGQRFAEARKKALAETLRRYANLQGHDTGTKTHLIAVDVSVEARHLVLQASEITEAPSERDEPWLQDSLRGVENSGAPGSPIRSLLQKAESAHRSLLAAQGFNVDHAGVQSGLGATVVNRLLPTHASLFPERSRERELAVAHAYLETETWALPDGGDVDLPGDGRPFWKQVDRIALAGIGDKLRGESQKVGWALDALPIRLSAQLVSQRYGDPSGDTSKMSCGSNELASTGKWRNGPKKDTKADGMSASKCFDTLPMEADKLGSGYMGDPTYRQLKARVEGYMGKGSEKPELIGKGP